METIVRKRKALILKYIVEQQLGWGRGNVAVVVVLFFNMLLIFILVALSLLFQRQMLH